MSVYLTEFESVEDIAEQYAVSAESLAGLTIHLAWYGYGDYCGESLVIFEQYGVLYEVNGSHCSCRGLEGQWQPEETSWEALKMRNLRGECRDSFIADRELQAVVAKNLRPRCIS